MNVLGIWAVPACKGLVADGKKSAQYAFTSTRAESHQFPPLRSCHAAHPAGGASPIARLVGECYSNTKHSLKGNKNIVCRQIENAWL